MLVKLNIHIDQRKLDIALGPVPGGLLELSTGVVTVGRREAVVERYGLVLECSECEGGPVPAPDCPCTGPQLLLCCPPGLVGVGGHQASIDVNWLSCSDYLMSQHQCTGNVLLLDIHPS